MGLRLTQRPHKYRAQATTVDGIKFASKAEARRYGELKLLKQAGEISGLTTHPRYVLQEGFRGRDGKMVRAITWKLDFGYREGAQEIVEDVKGGKATQTEAFRIKRRLFLKRYPEIELRIIESRGR
jgi:hypothetical protein